MASWVSTNMQIAMDSGFWKGGISTGMAQVILLRCTWRAGLIQMKGSALEAAIRKCKCDVRLVFLGPTA